MNKTNAIITFLLLILTSGCKNSLPESKISTAIPEKASHSSSESASEEHGEDEHFEPEKNGHGTEEQHEEEHAHEGEDQHEGEEIHEDGHEEKNADAHENHEEEGIVLLNLEKAKSMGIGLEMVKPERFYQTLRFPGEIELNEERVSHLSAPAEGRIVRISVSIGDNIIKGQTLASIKNLDLPQKRAEILTLLRDKSLSQQDLYRAKLLANNLQVALSHLSTKPALDSLSKIMDLDLGADLEPILHAYADQVLTRETYEREKDLLTKGITSRAEFQGAEAALRKAEASLSTVRSEALFQVKRQVMEKTNTLNSLETKLQVLANDLKALKVSSNNIQQILLGKNPPGWDELPVISQTRGKVLDRHASLGEWATVTEPLFTLSDNNEIWAKLKVTQDHLPLLTPQKMVHIHQPGSSLQAQGRVKRILPQVSEGSRQTEVLVTIPNGSGQWKVGAFIEGELRTSSRPAPLVISTNSILMIDGKATVFVKEEEGFKATSIILGEQNEDQTEILSGLKPGMEIASGDIFLLKAELGKSEAEHDH